jgi:6-pyruvoyltetrahydropterin/6-carboxytetrahydropterin synthase
MKNTDPRYNTTFKLWKDFTFEAAHQLTLVPPGHQCGRLHGHSYKVRIHCKGTLNQNDWVVDYAEIAKATRPIIEELDHSFLNHVLDIETTAENLAWWIGQRVVKKLSSHLYAVEVFETPTTSVVYEL